MPLTRLTLSSLLLMLTLPALAQTKPLTEAQYGTIKALGELNAVALHCKYINETRRMKKSLVLTLPKVRQFGEAFDIETNKAFWLLCKKNPAAPKNPLLPTGG